MTILVVRCDHVKQTHQMELQMQQEQWEERHCHQMHIVNLSKVITCFHTNVLAMLYRCGDEMLPSSPIISTSKCWRGTRLVLPMVGAAIRRKVRNARLYV